MENRSSQIWTILAVAAIVAVVAYWVGSQQTVNNPTFDVKADSSVKASHQLYKWVLFMTVKKGIQFLFLVVILQLASGTTQMVMPRFLILK